MAYAKELIEAVLGDTRITALLTKETIKAWKELSISIQDKQSMCDGVPSAERMMCLRTWPSIRFSGIAVYDDFARLHLEPALSYKDLIENSDGSSWAEIAEPNVKVTISAFYGLLHVEACKRLAIVMAALDLASRITDVTHTMPLVARIETREEHTEREEKQLAESKLAAINDHVCSCRERASLKPGEAKRCRSFDVQVAPALMIDSGSYYVTRKGKRDRRRGYGYDTRTYELTVGAPGGSIIRRIS